MKITKEFTKEQLIAKAEEQIKLTRGLNLTLSAKEHVDMCSVLFEIALASLEAEDKLSIFVASQESLGGDFERVLAENIEGLYVPGNSAPPAPVTLLTDEQIDDVLDSRGNILYVIADKRERLRMFAREILRAAMLKGAKS
ncbi:hypothetical protein DM877_11020 [Enterobacter cloacae]|uniref:Uncharacterized protein n=1 Tax=Enterobacter cloacae TaxID=550 RepID=A0A4Q2E9H6_ENTCL|nr:hypothetical protein [Enterobacter cloacae]RXW28932.1 hypothetical protein DM877_11020 [Enterobacter cloacae]